MAFPPRGAVTDDGVTAMEKSANTVMVVELDMVPCLAETVVEPAVKAEARPDAEMLATVVLEEVQVTPPVMFTTLPSVNVPVAVNCCVLPPGTDGFVGVTAIDTSVGAVTVNDAVPLMAPCIAVMFTGPPAANPFATPWFPAALLIVAIAVFEEDHVTDVVNACVELSE